jgi:hypothetical protein
MTVTTSMLTRAAAVSAVVSGLLFVVIQFIHPSDEVSSVTTSAWVIVAYLTLAMSILGLVGATGVYLRQVKESGLLGLIGFVLFSLFLLLTTAFTFIEALVLPALAKQAPHIVEDINGIFGGVAADGSLGALETVAPVAFAVYLLGGVLFGIAIFRARVLQRWSGILLAVGAASTLLIPLLPHELGRLAAVPVGLALVWLGTSLWLKQRTPATRSMPGIPSSPLERAAAE